MYLCYLFKEKRKTNKKIVYEAATCFRLFFIITLKKKRKICIFYNVKKKIYENRKTIIYLKKKK